MICKYCRKELDVSVGGYYELWRLAMPAHLSGYMCQKCYDKRWFIRIKKFFKNLWKKFINK